MEITFRQTRPEDLPRITELLQCAFRASPSAPFLDPKLLHWKYFSPDAEGRAGRGYVLEQNGRLLAHGCLWPVPLQVASGPVEAKCLLDWVSAEDSPGMGVQLVRKVAELTPVLLSIGGSDATRKIMPKIGFERKGELLSYAHVLRPLRQFETRPRGNPLKEALRLARNSAWSWGVTEQPQGWTVRPSTDANDFLLSCPAAEVTAFDMLRYGQPMGELLLSRVGGECRIASLRIGRPGPKTLTAAYAAILETARQYPEASELVATTFDGVTRWALEQNSFRYRAERPVFVMDTAGCLSPADFPLPLDMRADDMAYMNIPENPYLT